jgi:indole-3-acetate monooxygenase
MAVTGSELVPTTVGRGPAGAKERLLETVRNLEEEIRRQGPLMDGERKLAPKLADALAQAGFFRMLAPAPVGGLEMEPLAAAEGVEAMARVDGSTGWCVMVGAQWQWYVALLPLQGQERIFGQANLKVAGARKPGGKARRVEGGYRVSGQWGLASGCTYADWLAAACVLEDDADAATRKSPEVRMVYLPASEATIMDNWKTPGLRGTASNDFALDGVFVPEELTTISPEPGSPIYPGPLYRTAYQNLAYVLQGAQALGVARGAFDSFIGVAGKRVRWVATSGLADDAVVRATAGEAEVLIASARAWLWSAAADAWAALVAGGEPSREQRLQLRLAITHAIRASMRAADLLQDASGAAALREDHPLQRQWQDLRMAVAHVQATPKILELAGGLLLGADVPVSPALV